MKSIGIAVVAVSLTALIVGCSSRLPIVGPAEAHGVVVTQAEQRADHTHPVHIVAINGRAVPLDHSGPMLIAPGVHTFRLSPIIAGQQVRDVRRGQRRDDPDAYIDINVQPGMRYVVAARETGANMSEWRAVVTRIEAIR